jgi:hypothetical protein
MKNSSFSFGVLNMVGREAPLEEIAGAGPVFLVESAGFPSGGVAKVTLRAREAVSLLIQ